MKIKKFLAGFIAFTILCSVICTDNKVIFEIINTVIVSAETYTLENGLEYEIVNSDEGTQTITITDFNDNADIVEIPSEINGKSVTRIGNAAFRNCDITNIIIPDTVTSIGWNAFENCSELTEIIIPDSVVTIDGNTFDMCTNLINIKLPNGLRGIPDSMFISCRSIKEIEIPKSVKSIDDNAFRGCTSLENIELPSQLASLGSYLFTNCSSLKEIKIPYKITSLGKSVFVNCTNLTSITLPKNLKDACVSFEGCTNLKDIYYTGTKEEWRCIDFDGNTGGRINIEYADCEEENCEFVTMYETIYNKETTIDNAKLHYNVYDPDAPEPITADTSWFDAENPQQIYDISTAEQLAGLSELVNEGNSMAGITFNLTADIKMNDTSNFDNWYEQPPKNKWIPIGTEKNICPFSGYFNGNGHCIEGMYVYTETYGGLFGLIYGSAVVNLIMRDCFVFTQSDTNVSNKCFVYSGGIVGLMDGGLIDNCDFDGKVYAYGTGSGLDMDANVSTGGIVGSFTVSDASVPGGLFGNLLIGIFSGYILVPTLVHSISGGGSGVVNRCLVSNCINRGEIRILNKSIGDGCIGGIAGFCHTGKILSCINIGSMYNTINGITYSDNLVAGGVIAEEFNTCMDKCYYQANTLNQGVGIIRGDGAVFEDEKPGDTAIKTTADEIAALSQKELENNISECFINKNNKTYLKCDLNMNTADIQPEEPTTTTTPVTTTTEPITTTTSVTTTTEPIITTTTSVTTTTEPIITTTTPVTTTTESIITTTTSVTTAKINSIKGDLDNDGKTTSNDALNILQAVTNSINLTNEQKKLADLDGDGEITSVDALYILQIVVGLR